MCYNTNINLAYIKNINMLCEQGGVKYENNYIC